MARSRRGRALKRHAAVMPRGLERAWNRGSPALRASALILLLATPTLAPADTRCRKDTFGNTICTDDRGNTTRGTRDTFGNEVWTDSDGHVTRGRTDTFGNKVYTDDRGNTVRCTRDTFGTEVCK